jgi:hypothetical protein
MNIFRNNRGTGMRGLFRKAYDNKYLVLAVLALGLMLSPLLYMVFFSVPAADDFANSSKMRILLQADGGLLSYVKYVFQLAADVYRTTQGCFFTNFLIYVNPIPYNLDLIWLPLLLNFAVLIISTFVFSYTVAKYFFMQGLKTAAWLFVLVLFMSTQYIAPGETLFWYAGAVAYTMPYSLMLLFFSLVIKCWFADKIKLKDFILSLLLGLLSTGTNYTTSLTIWFIMFIVMAFGFILKRKNRVYNLVVFLITFAGLIINVTAPGNMIRKSYYPPISIVKSIILSFYSSINYIFTNMQETPLVFLLIICIPVMFKIVKGINYSFRYPLIVNGISFAVLSAAYTPNIYGYGYLGFPPRYINIVYFLFIWIFVLNCFYIAGWVSKKYSFTVDSKNLMFVIVIAAILSFSQTFSMGALESMASVKAARQIVSGNAGNYKNEVYNLFSSLDTSKEKNIIIKPFKYKNPVVFPLELFEDPTEWRNGAIATFFGKESIIRK